MQIEKTTNDTFINFSCRNIAVLWHVRLDSLNHIRISLVSRQLSCVDTCQIESGIWHFNNVRCWRTDEIIKTEGLGLLTLWGPIYLHDLTLISAWISNQISSKVWDKITYPFPYFNDYTYEVCKWMSNFIPHIVMDVIIYPCWDKSYATVVKRGALTCNLNWVN